MKKFLTAILILSLSPTLSISTANAHDDDRHGDADKQSPLVGTWQSPYFEVSPMGGYTYRRYQLKRDGSWNSSFRTYADRDFESGGFTVEEVGTAFQIVSEHPTLPDSDILELTRGKIFVTIRDRETFDTLSQIGLFPCIGEDQIGMRIDVTDISCPPIPELASCADEYELLSTGRYDITFGERGPDNCSADGVGETLSTLPLVNKRVLKRIIHTKKSKHSHHRRHKNRGKH